MTKSKRKVGVILMTYGSPKTLDDVSQYLKNVYGGKEASEDTIKEFKRRYELIKGSPLIEITNNQASKLQEYLNKNSTDKEYIVKAGMRFSAPFIPDVLKDLSNDVSEIVGIIMSPQYSPIIMKGYVNVFNNSLKGSGIPHKVAGDWHDNKHFIKAVGQKVIEALKEFGPEAKDITVLFSAHSMPKRVIENEPDYIDNLKQTAKLIAKSVKIQSSKWMFCYQSAGHTPEEWLKPDFADIMPLLQKEGKKHVLIAPVQFLADHLETLYDIEIGAREQAEIYGIGFKRTKSLNVAPLFIEALADVTRENESQ